MKKNPTVSIIVTTFNRREMLTETVNSILCQTYDDFELIIVDNLSIDGTGDYVRSLNDPRVRYLINPNYGVIAVNRNYGIKNSIGEYIAFCDDDDLWIPNKLEIQLELINSKPNLMLCYGQAASFLDDQLVRNKMNRQRIYFSHFYDLLQGNYIANSTVLLRRSVFNQIGILNESPNLREDYEMWLRVSHSYEIIGSNQALIKYRLHNNNNAGGKCAETKRAIRTLTSLVGPLKIPCYLYFPNLCIHYLKYLIYAFKGL